MVDIHFIATSSHPSHREQETEREVTSCSRWEDPDALAASTQCQHSPRMVRTPPPAADVGATLAAACQLLNNPPSVHAFHQPWSSGITTSISSSSPPSTPRTMREGSRNRRWHIHAPLGCACTAICSHASSATRTTEHRNDRPPR
jgi:hypothetical protein